MKFNEEAHDVLRSNLNAIGVIASTLGVIIGISGMGHGFFEALQGNRATNGFIIYAVGKGNQYTRWTNGNEGAFTLIPNFLITGIFAMIIAFLLAIWSVHFIQTKRGSSVFLLIGTILFLVGGGVAQLPYIVLTWAVATRINKPLTWWKTNISGNIRSSLAKAWLWTLIVAAFSFLLALEIAIFGFLPGVNNLNMLQIIDWSILGFATIILIISIIAGFVHDGEKQVNSALAQTKKTL